MRPLGTSEQLAKRRQQALELLKSGKAIQEIATQMGTTERSIRRWRQEATHPKKKSKRGPGKQAYLSKQQTQKLERELLKGAYAHGYVEDYWTLDRIGHVIWELFHRRYVPSGVWRLLTRLGWSNQRVQRLAIQREEKMIKNWKVHQVSRIKKTM